MAIKIPPFIDRHIHFLRNGLPITVQEAEEIKRSLISSGILSICDMGHSSGIGLEVKRLWQSEPLQVRSCGYAIHKKGGYGSFLGTGVSDEKEISEVVRRIAREGADFIKVINSGIVSITPEMPVTDGGFSREELRVIVEEAGEMGLEVICHANSDRAIREAVSAGVTSIEHGFFVSEETLYMLKEESVSWTPTVYALLSFAIGQPVDVRSYLEGVIDRHLESVYIAHSIGVRLHVGTDSGSRGVSHGKAFFEELRLFKKAGLSDRDLIGCGCMEEREVSSGNYIILSDGGIEEATIEAVYFQGKRIL